MYPGTDVDVRELKKKNRLLKLFRLYRIQRLIDAMRVQAHILKSTLLCTYVFLFSIGFFIDAMRVQAHVLKSTLYAPHVFYFFIALFWTPCANRHKFSKVLSVEMTSGTHSQKYPL